MKKKAEAPQKPECTSKETIRRVSEIELLNLIELELSDPSHKVLI